VAAAHVLIAKVYANLDHVVALAKRRRAMKNLDIKLLLSIGAILTVLGGFYYTTQLRLERLEETEQFQEIGKLKKQIMQIKKRVKKLEDAR